METAVGTQGEQGQQHDEHPRDHEQYFTATDLAPRGLRIVNAKILLGHGSSS